MLASTASSTAADIGAVIAWVIVVAVLLKLGEVLVAVSSVVLLLVGAAVGPIRQALSWRAKRSQTRATNPREVLDYVMALGYTDRTNLAVYNADSFKTAREREAYRAGWEERIRDESRYGADQWGVIAPEIIKGKSNVERDQQE